MKPPVALITGASSGIGLELARIHASRGGSLVVVARRMERLEALCDELKDAHGTECVALGMDLSEEDAPARIYDDLARRGAAVDYLMNNAGFGGIGRFHERAWDDDRAMIQVNIIALMHLTHLFVADMVRRGSGRILQVGSIAGFVPGPLQATYYASKAFINSFSQALAQELEGSNVTMTVLCPGTTATEFFDRAHMEGTLAKRLPRNSADTVARLGYDAMLRGRRMVITGWHNRLTAQLLRVAPRRLATRASMAFLKSRTNP